MHLLNLWLFSHRSVVWSGITSRAICFWNMATMWPLGLWLGYSWTLVPCQWNSCGGVLCCIFGGWFMTTAWLYEDLHSLSTHPPSLSHSHTPRLYYYLPVVAVCVVAFLFPSGRNSGQKKTKTKPVTATELDRSTRNGEILADKKTAWETLSLWTHIIYKLDDHYQVVLHHHPGW